MLDWDYDEIEQFWFCGEPQHGCGVTKLNNEWWVRVVINSSPEPWGPYKTAKEGRVKAEEEWKRRTESSEKSYYDLI